MPIPDNENTRRLNHTRIPGPYMVVAVATLKIQKTRPCDITGSSNCRHDKRATVTREMKGTLTSQRVVNVNDGIIECEIIRQERDRERWSHRPPQIMERHTISNDHRNTDYKQVERARSGHMWSSMYDLSHYLLPLFSLSSVHVHLFEVLTFLSLYDYVYDYVYVCVCDH